MSTVGPTLREQLGGSRDPEFELQLLPGWHRRTPDEADEQRIEAALRQRFMQAHRPDLLVEARSLVRESHAVMRREGVVAYYAASDPGEDTLWLPGSLLVTVRTPPPGGTLDDVVRSAIRELGAEPLLGDKRFMRFVREKPLDLGGASMISTTIEYLTPIPGSRRRRALQLTAAFARPADVPADDERIRAYAFAFDACVSTLQWLPPSGGAQA